MYPICRTDTLARSAATVVYEPIYGSRNARARAQKYDVGECSVAFRATRGAFENTSPPTGKMNGRRVVRNTDRHAVTIFFCRRHGFRNVHPVRQSKRTFFSKRYERFSGRFRLAVRTGIVIILRARLVPLKEIATTDV